MHVVVGGCGRLGSEMAEQLARVPENDVVVIDIEPAAFDHLGSAFNGETIQGDVTDRDTLELAGIARADGLLAVTRYDNANLMAVEIAQHLYGVPRAVARLFNPEREGVYRQLGVRYVSGTGILAKLFLNEFREQTFPHHLDFDDADTAVVDMEIGPTGAGLTVDEFEVDGRLRVAAIERAHRVIIPTSGDRLEQGDRVTAAVRRGVYARVDHLLQSPHERPIANRG